LRHCDRCGPTAFRPTKLLLRWGHSSEFSDRKSPSARFTEAIGDR
jgi:hypothetical protein